MSNTYGTIITTKGAAIIADCIVNGGQLVISEAAAGDGNGAYYQPTVNQEHLVHECWRGEIAAAELNPSTPNMLDVKIVIGDEVGGFTIREMGLFSEDGTLIAVCNTPDTEKVAISGGVSGKLTMVMHIIVADASVVEFTINPSLDTVSQENLMRLLHCTTPAASATLTSACLHLTPCRWGMPIPKRKVMHALHPVSARTMQTQRHTPLFCPAYQALTAASQRLS